MSSENVQLPASVSSGQISWATYLLYGPDAKPPTKASVDTAWYDLVSSQDMTIAPQSNDSISTGVGFILPRSIAGWVVGAEGLLKKGLLMEPFVVSPDNENVVKVTIFNVQSKPYEVKLGEKIARIVFKRILNQRAMYPKRHVFQKRVISEDTVD